MPHITVASEGSLWAVKHDGAYLGLVQTEQDAETLAAVLRAACKELRDNEEIRPAERLAQWRGWSREGSA